MVPLVTPVEDGVVVTLIVQLSPPARDAGQLLVWLNSGVTVMLVMVAGDPPALCKVITVADDVAPTTTLPKLTVDGDRVRVAGTTPTPLSGVRLGDPVALDATDRLAFRVPEPVGWKKTVMVQAFDAGNVTGQLFDCEYDPAATPVRLIVPTARLIFPVLVRVKAWQVDDAPTWTEPQEPLAGVTLAMGAPPVPLSVDDGLLASVKALKVAVLAPALGGQNLTFVVQDAPGATTELLQLPLGANENWKST